MLLSIIFEKICIFLQSNASSTSNLNFTKLMRLDTLTNSHTFFVQMVLFVNILRCFVFFGLRLKKIRRVK